MIDRDDDLVRVGIRKAIGGEYRQIRWDFAKQALLDEPRPEPRRSYDYYGQYQRGVKAWRDALEAGDTALATKIRAWIDKANEEFPHFAERQIDR